jgi:hypothetical protein
MNLGLKILRVQEKGGRTDPRSGPGVNTKNWYRKETDLWAEFGQETPFSRKFSSKDSVKIPTVGSAPSFGRRAVCA